MKGPCANGQGMHDINNRCQGLDGRCGAPMPLPESHGKHCTRCGTRVRTWDEMSRENPGAIAAISGGVANKPHLDRYVPKCPACGADIGGKDKFCRECGVQVTGNPPEPGLAQTKCRKCDARVFASTESCAACGECLTEPDGRKTDIRRMLGG